MASANILIAEDDAVLRDVYVKKFTIAGYDIRTVENGQQAIEAIDEKAPDILIVDLHMPTVDGFGILERYPQDSRSFPVIVLTNFGDDQNRKKAEELGANDYFIKSDMTIKSLIEMVENLLKAKKMWGGK